MVYKCVYTDAALHNSLPRFAAALIETVILQRPIKKEYGVKFVHLPRHVKEIHYAWVMLGVAIAMRLISSVERTASGVLLAYLVDPAGEFGWSRSVVGLALSLQWICSGVFAPPAGWMGDRYGLRDRKSVV